MTRSLILLAAAAAVGLSGCVGMSRSSPIEALPADWASNARVEQIVLAKDDIKVTPQFDDIFRARVQAKLNQCAKGSRPLRLEAKISRLDKANPVMTAVIGGANVMRGEGKLIDVATGQTVGDYQVGQTVVGGRVAVFMMGEAEEQMSDAYGDELCKQAFPAAK